MLPNYKDNPLEYRAWTDMKTRCFNRKFKDFHLYGGKGITIFRPWIISFPRFYSDVGPKPTPDYSLDRFPNPKGNYEPGNVRWATSKQQARNWGTRNRLLAFQGKILPLSQWAEELKITRETIRDRLDDGWTITQALSTPIVTVRRRDSKGLYVKAISD